MRMKALMMVAGILAAAGCTTPPSSVDGADPPEYLNSGKLLPTNLPFSEAVRVGNTL